MELLKQEKEQLFRTEDNVTKDQQLQFLQQTMQGMQQVPGPRLFFFFREGKGCVRSADVRREPFAGKGEGEERTSAKLARKGKCR